MLRKIVDVVLPPRCPGCGAVVDADHRFCVACWMQLDFLPPEGCALCNLPLEAVAGSVCGVCLADPPRHDGVIAAVAYGEVSRRVALRLKHARRPGLARTMAAVLAPRVPADAVLVPVPLHRWRIWRRGFNQSLALARGLSQLTGTVTEGDLLVRRRATPMLRGLDPKARREAVRGAFSARSRVDGAHLCLIDDVYTTGATANACAAVLKRAGAARVTVVVWARVLNDD